MTCPDCKGVLSVSCALCHGTGVVVLLCNWCGKMERACNCDKSKSTEKDITL